MIQGYRMAGPPPHGEPPKPRPPSASGPCGSGFAALVVAAGRPAWSAPIVVVVATRARGRRRPARVGRPRARASLLQASLLAAALVAAPAGQAAAPVAVRAAPTRFWPAVGWAALGLVVFSSLAICLGRHRRRARADDRRGHRRRREPAGADRRRASCSSSSRRSARSCSSAGFFYGALRTPLPPVLGDADRAASSSARSTRPRGIEAVPLLIVLGIVFCLVREKTGSLYPCIAHARAQQHARLRGPDRRRARHRAPRSGAVMLTATRAGRAVRLAPGARAGVSVTAAAPPAATLPDPPEMPEGADPFPRWPVWYGASGFVIGIGAGHRRRCCCCRRAIGRRHRGASTSTPTTRCPSSSSSRRSSRTSAGSSAPIVLAAKVAPAEARGISASAARGSVPRPAGRSSAIAGLHRPRAALHADPPARERASRSRPATASAR